MKKVILIGLLALLLGVVGCSSSKAEEKSLTLNDFIKAYTDQGVEVDPNEKQMYQMIGAKDGVIFYMDNSPVKIYEFESVKDMKKAISNDDDLKDWPSNDRFLLETSKQEAVQIFQNVK